jgi:hypothetical protein
VFEAKIAHHMQCGHKMTLERQSQVGRKEGNFSGDINLTEFNHPPHDTNKVLIKSSVGPIFDLPLFNVSTDTMYCIKISIYLYFVAVKLSTIINLFKLYFSFFCYNVQHIYDTVYMFLFRCTDSIAISNVILFNYH